MNQQNKEQNEKKHNYFYKITNLISGKFYYGIHSTNNLDDEYMGSSKYIKKDFDIFGIENFQKEIIVDYPSRKEASDHEVKILTKELLQNPMCYNLSAAGINWKIRYPSEEQKNKTSNSLKGRTFTPEHLEKLSKSARKYRTNEEKEHLRIINTGKKHTEKTKHKMSETRKGRVCKLETRKKISEKQMGDKNHRFGKKHTEEWKQEQSKRRKGRSGTPHSKETKEKISKNNPRAKPCIINGVEFRNLKKASECLSVCVETIKNRINSDSDKWIDWKYKC